MTCAVLALCAPASAAAEERERIVLKREAGLTAAECTDIRADAGVELSHTLPLAGVEVVVAEPGERGDAMRRLRADPDVVWAEPDRVRRAATTDAHFGYLWGLENTGQPVWGYYGKTDADIDAPQAWEVTKGDGITVAVVDSGIDASHPDLAGKLVPGYDWVDDDSVPQDGNGHGTHVAGTIAAAEDAGGVVGVAPNATIMPLRTLDDDGSGWSSDVAAAFAYAGARGVRVVNASLSADMPGAAEQQAIRDHPNTLFIVAASNGGTDGVGDDNDVTPRYPCAYPEPNVICVGASNQFDEPTGFSNFGRTTVDLFAPGHRIVSTYPLAKSSRLDHYYSTGAGFEILAGTSMATPHAAGAAALVFAQDPARTSAAVKQALMESVDPIPALDGLSVTGGRLNASRALSDADVTPPPVPTGVSATAGDATVALSWTAGSDPDIAGYNVYYWVEGAGLIPYGEALTATQVTIGSLVNGSTYKFWVTAVDSAGNESPRSQSATATPADTGTPAAPTPSPTPTATPEPAPAPPTTGAPTDAAPEKPHVPDPAPGTRAPAIMDLDVAVKAPARRGRGARTATLAFALSAAARVDLRVEQRVCRPRGCRYAVRGRARVRTQAGAHRWAIGRGLAGVKLTPGRWRVTLTTAAGSSTARFAVAAR